MANMSGAMSEKLESFGSVLKQKMKEIYEHHQKVSQGVEDQVNVLKQANTGLERLNERMQNEVDMLQDRINVLQADNKRLSGELVNTSTRLSAPCENCKSLMQQLDQQNKLVCTLLEKHDLSITSILEKYLKDKFEKQHISKTTESATVPSVLHVLSQALHNTQSATGEDNSQPKTLQQSEQRDVKKRENSRVKDKENRDEEITKRDYIYGGHNDIIMSDMARSNINVETDPPRTLEATDNDENIKKSGQNHINNEQTQSNVNLSKCDYFDTNNEAGADANSKISPTNAKLKLHRGKRSRHKYIEENAPESKRKKILPESSTMSRKLKAGLVTCSQETSSRVCPHEYTVLVPDTCNVSSLLSPRYEVARSRTKTMKNRNERRTISDQNEGKTISDQTEGRTISDQKSPGENANDIKKSMVPDTVPMEASLSDDDSCQSENTVKKQTQVSVNNQPNNKAVNIIERKVVPKHKSKDVKHLLSSVLFSPPSHSSTPLPVSPEASSDLVDHSGSFISNKETTNHAFSPPSSPVFGKSASPPLFEESGNNTNVRNYRTRNKDDNGFTKHTKSRNSNQNTSMRKLSNDDKNTIRQTSDSGNNSDLSANESSLLLSKPNSMKSNDKNSQKLVKAESIQNRTKSSPRVRMSPLNFSVERAGEAVIKSPTVSESPSMLSGKVKGIVASPKMIKSKSPKGKVGEMLLEKGNMKKIKGKYFQTKLTSDAFKSRNTNKIRLEQYNGNGPGTNADSLTQQEEELLEQAKVASLQESKDHDNDVVTSTPAVNSNRPTEIPDLSVIDHQYSVLVFKKPIPPTTPKRRNSANDEEILRRSPRIKSLQMSFGYSHAEVKQRITVNEESEHMGVANRDQHDLNGTVDPHINLADFDSPGRMKSQYLDNITMYDLDRAQNAVSTQDYLASLENINKRVTRANSKASQELQAASEDSQLSKKSRQQSQKSKRQNQKSQISQKFTDNQENDMSEKSAVFGPMSMKPNIQKDLVSAESCQDVFSSQAFTDKEHISKVCDDQLPDVDDSFDRLPQQIDDKGYKYVKVVRKQAERAKLDTYVCIECDKWFNGMGLSEEEKHQRMKAGCKHKAMFAPPDTPEHYWSVGFPDTQQCKERGYMNITQAKPSKYRRQRPLRQLFKQDNEGNEGEEQEASDFSD